MRAVRLLLMTIATASAARADLVRLESPASPNPGAAVLSRIGSSRDFKFGGAVVTPQGIAPALAQGAIHLTRDTVHYATLEPSSPGVTGVGSMGGGGGGAEGGAGYTRPGDNGVITGGGGAGSATGPPPGMEPTGVSTPAPGAALLGLIGLASVDCLVTITRRRRR